MAHGVGVPADHNPCELYFERRDSGESDSVVLSQPQFELTAPSNCVNLLLAEGFGYFKGDPIPH